MKTEELFKIIPGLSKEELELIKRIEENDKTLSIKIAEKLHIDFSAMCEKSEKGNGIFYYAYVDDFQFYVENFKLFWMFDKESSTYINEAGKEFDLRDYNIGSTLDTCVETVYIEELESVLVNMIDLKKMLG